MSQTNFDITVTKGVTIKPIVMKFKETVTPLKYLNITGWQVRAEVRLRVGSDVILNLNPSITNALEGEVTIQKTDEETASLPAGVYKWDLIFESDSGQIFGPFIGGRFIIKEKITNS